MLFIIISHILYIATKVLLFGHICKYIIWNYRNFVQIPQYRICAYAPLQQQRHFA